MSDKCEHTILEEGRYMMEIKVANAMPKELSEKLSEFGIFPVSFSKYGRGFVDMMTTSRGRVVSPVHEYGFAEEKGAVAYAG